MNSVAVRMGNAKATRIMLVSTLQAKIGIFKSVMPGARILRMVVMKLMPESRLPRPAICRLQIQ